MPATGQDVPEIDEADLSRPKPLGPDEAVRTFRLPPGFVIEPVAVEPDVVDPVAIAFDASGALYVVEMRDYSERRHEKLSRVRRLTDRDGDGTYETSTVFLDGLAWATGVACWRDGAFVAASPDILFARDTDGDGVADQRETALTGFGTGRQLNVQALLNSLTFDPENRITGATAGNGGLVDGIPLQQADFSFDPDTRRVRAEAGTAQYGLTFDAFGRRFVCSNSAHLQWVALERPYGDAGLLPGLTRIFNIAVDGPAAPVFRTSPEESWRVVRTNLRASGAVQGIVEGGGRASGYFTSATGLIVYSGDRLGSEYTGNVFVGDVGSNLVHRKVIVETPDGPSAVRAPEEETREFLTSTDNWFRPVACANGPDGCLYVIDMYREVIEHPDSFPPVIKKRLDLNSGNDRGRIWRIRPEAVPGRPRSLPGGCTTEELARMTAHPNGWHRETARRLLIERRDPAAVPVLREILTADALSALAGLNAFTASDAGRALASTDAAVIIRALRLLETRPEIASGLDAAIGGLTAHPAPAVRRQLALSLSRWKSPNRNDWRAALWPRNSSSPNLRIALLAGLDSGDDALALLRMLPEPDDDLCGILARSGDSGAIAGAAALIRERAASDLPRALQLAARLRDPTLNASLREAATGLLLSSSAPAGDRLAAARFLAADSNPEAGEALKRTFLDPAAPNDVRLAALPGIPADRAPSLFAAWGSLSAAMRNALIDQALVRESWTPVLLEAIARGTPEPGALVAAQTTRLRNHSTPAIRDRALRLLGPPPPSRQDAINARLPALRLEGDPDRGEGIFLQHCQLCHRSGSDGFEVGPDRESLRNQGKPLLLAHIIDPNREVAPRYATTIVTSTDGETWAGLVASDDAAGISLTLPGGAVATIERSRIRSVTQSGVSLMPEGLTEPLSDQELADLLAFLVK